MNIRSGLRIATDRAWSRLTARPVWTEREGASLIPVHGFSIIDSLIVASGGLAVLIACIVTLAVLP